MEDVSSSKKAVILVPTHLERLDDDSAAVLLHNAQALASYPLEVILPDTCSPDWYEAFFAEHRIQGTARLLPSKYFGSAAAVNKMGMDPDFYQLYLKYDFVLICHLDAWVFDGQLDDWMEQGYDFIGAPLFLPDVGRGHFTRRMAPYGCNGGLSLRRVSTCIRVLETLRPGLNPYRVAQGFWFLILNQRFDYCVILLRLLWFLCRDWRDTCARYNIYEDVFFTGVAPMMGAAIRIPPSRVAVHFACEVNYDHLQKELLGTSPPFGIHGFDKYLDPKQLAHWQSFFDRKRQFYDGENLPVQPRVSIVMIVKDLINNGRMEVFRQALQSVESQSYSNIEIVVLDGGSSDKTFETIKKAYRDIPNIVFYRKADKSVWEGMSNGVGFSTGDLIGVINSDDYYASNEAVAQMVTKLTAEKADWVFGQTKLLFKEGNETIFPTHLPSVLNCFGIVHQATLIKRSLIDTIKPFDSNHITAENYLLVSLLAAGFKVAEVKQIVVHYRVGGLSSEMYSGPNYSRTVADYVAYMQKVTSVRAYLNSDEIAQLYGFQGVKDSGFLSFLGLIRKVGDQRLRQLLLQALWNQIQSHGVRRLVMRKVKFLIRRYVK